MNHRIGPEASGQAHQRPRAHLPVELASVALINANTAAAGGAVSVSWWYEKVAAGEAPQPAFRSPRCTRWRLADVTEFWRNFAKTCGRGNEVVEQARKASKAAKAKRAAGTDHLGD